MRESTIARRTLETDIEVALNLDGAGTADVSSRMSDFSTICSPRSPVTDVSIFPRG